jgi:Rps23 Pro-64 3,4-dihydroxylase Tpa1-like proline 4-hydroxylase
MSQVYYVSVTNNSSPLVFTDLDVEITPESGMLITFPSYLMHSVSPLEKDDQRVVISVNWLFSERKQSNGSN